MPRSDFPDLLHILVNCSACLIVLRKGQKYLSARSCSGYGLWASLRKNKETFLWVIYILGGFIFEWCSSEALLFSVLVRDIQGHPGTNSAGAPHWWHRLKAEPVFYKTSRFRRNLSFPVIRWKWMILYEIVLIARQVGVGVSFLFMIKPGRIKLTAPNCQ